MQAMRRMQQYAVIISMMAVSACTAQTAELEPELDVHESALSPDTRKIYNFAGQPRYVKVNAREVKLLFNPDKGPRYGFYDSNHFDNSCGPTAAINVFKWYGIDVLEGDHCFWHHESEADTGGANIPPTWVCQPRITAHKLGREMQTNTWRLATFTMSGTNTANFRSVFSKYVQRWMPDDDVYEYKYEEGDGLTQYQRLWSTLAQGHPIVVNYKTGATKGHFATIVGMEKVGNDNDLSNDKVYLANPRKEDLEDAISWGKFRGLWRRDYNDFGALAAVGERRYTRINVRDVSVPPSGGAGPGIPMPENPVVVK
jgi:hypothetical protein